VINEQDGQIRLKPLTETSNDTIFPDSLVFVLFHSKIAIRWKCYSLPANWRENAPFYEGIVFSYSTKEKKSALPSESVSTHKSLETKNALFKGLKGQPSKNKDSYLLISANIPFVVLQQIIAYWRTMITAPNSRNILEFDCDSLVQEFDKHSGWDEDKDEDERKEIILESPKSTKEEEEEEEE